MPQTEREPLDWRDVLDVTLAVLTVGFLVWVTFPGVQLTVKGWWQELRDGWEARDARERIEAEMASEVWHVRRVLDEGGDIAGGLGLTA